MPVFTIISRCFIVAFQIYDVDNDGFISPEDFTECLQLMVGSTMNPQEVELIARHYVLEADKDGDGKLSLEEFSQALAGTNVEDLLSVKVH